MSDTVTKQEFDAFGTKLFKYLDKRFEKIDDRFEATDNRFDQLLSTVDAYAKQVEMYHQESIARDAHVERPQRWIEQIAKKTGVKLEY